jgi:hypothetical protein
VLTRRSRVVEAVARTPSTVGRVLPTPVLRLRIAALVAAQMFDYGTFTVMVERHGIQAELNPIVANGFAAFGLPIVALSKLALVVLIGSIIVILAHDRGASRGTMRIASAVTILAVVAGLFGGISNILT